MEKNREKSLQKALPSAGAKGVKVRRSCWELSRASSCSKGPACEDCSLGRERQEPLQPTEGEQRIFPCPTFPLPGSHGAWPRGQPPEYRAGRERAEQMWTASRNIWQVSPQGCSHKEHLKNKMFIGWNLLRLAPRS